MLFAKGTWAILGIEPESHDSFLKTLDNAGCIYAFSQAYTLAEMRENPKLSLTTGINPFENPRKDEQGPPLGDDFKDDNAIAAYNPDHAVFGVGDEFRISSEQHWYGLWFVFNEAEDVDDIKSKQEQFAYTECSRPFKFLAKEQRKAVAEAAKPLNAGTRKQIPALLDFESGRVYIASTNADEVSACRSVLEAMGVAIHGLAWNFGDPEWAETFLNKVQSMNKFTTPMDDRASAIRTHAGYDVEPFEDKAVEAVVKKFFALSELDTGLWTGLFPTADSALWRRRTRDGFASFRCLRPAHGQSQCAFPPGLSSRSRVPGAGLSLRQERCGETVPHRPLCL